MKLINIHIIAVVVVTVVVTKLAAIVAVSSFLCSTRENYLIVFMPMSKTWGKIHHFHEKCDQSRGETQHGKRWNIHWEVICALVNPRASAEKCGHERCLLLHICCFAFSSPLLQKWLFVPRYFFDIMEENKFFHTMKILILLSRVWKVIKRGGS